MNGQTAQAERAPTEEDILDYLRADYRIRCGVDPEVFPGEVLTAETTVADWRFVCDLTSTRRLAPVLAAWFGTPEGAAAAADWRRVLEPEDERTLGDVAAFAVARGGRWPDFAPLRVAGAADAAAGAFFYLRGALARAGAPVRDVRPSTALAPYLLPPYFEPLVGAVAKAAPALVPEPRVEWAPGRRGVSAAAVATGLGAAAAALARASLAALGAGAGMVLAGLWLARGAPQRVKFGPYHTFSDLARAIARSRQAAA